MREIRRSGVWLAVVLAVGAAGTARAEDPPIVRLTIKDHRFDPAEVRVPAGKVFVLEVKNEDATAEELESRPLKIEKVIAGRKTASVRVRALEKGRYGFFGDYHQATAQGAVVAE